MKVYENIEQLVGNTPLLRLKNIEREFNLNSKIFAKLEYFNPAGSIKDRAAKKMIEDAEKNGRISAGGTIIEATSGNTGIALAAIGSSKGYNVILTMPDSMSLERQKILKMYGAQVVLTDGAKGMHGAVDKAIELNSSIKNSIIMNQFENESNPKAHYISTAKEIYDALDGEFDFIVSCFGTGGTVSGVGKFIKEIDSNIKIIAVEPEESPLLTKGRVGKHKIQGIGANFIPKNLDKSVVDEFITARSNDALDCARMVARKEGVLVGISSGAALKVAIDIAYRMENKDKSIVVIFPDAGERYISTELFE